MVDEVTKHERDSSQGRRAAARLRSGAGVRSARLGWGVEGVRLGLCYWAGLNSGVGLGVIGLNSDTTEF